MNTKRIIITITISLVFFLGSFFLFIRSREKITEDVLQDQPLTSFNNERFGHTLRYPDAWQIRERESLSHFHTSLSSDSLPEININWGTYRQVSRHMFIALSDFTHLDGAVEHQIEYAVYPDNNNLSLTQWYDIFVLNELVSSQLITESQLIQRATNILESNVRVADQYNIYDPWTPKGELLLIGNHEVLLTQIPGDFRYDAYQAYILKIENYFVTISFGYRRGTVNRTLWKRNNSSIKTVIENIKSI